MIDNFNKFNILYKSKIITIMTIEDLEMWDGFDKIYPSYIRFPETIGFNKNNYCNRKRELSNLKLQLKRIDKYIYKMTYSHTLKGRVS